MKRLSLYTVLTLFVASACATGESLGDVGSDILADGGGVDASVHGETGGATGSGGASPLGSGGTTDVGGTESAGTGSVVSGGGSGAVSTGTGGATNAGGKASAGGAKSTGGASGKGGTMADSGADAAPSCIPGQKQCASDGLCWPPSAAHGCDLGSACTPCPTATANGYAKCTANACDFDCLGGYTKSGGQCISGGGGAGGGGSGGGGGTGTGGGPPACDAKTCGGCNPLQSPCCKKNNGGCGCAWPFASCG